MALQKIFTYKYTIIIYLTQQNLSINSNADLQEPLTHGTCIIITCTSTGFVTKIVSRSTALKNLSRIYTCIVHVHTCLRYMSNMYMYIFTCTFEIALGYFC